VSLEKVKLLNEMRKKLARDEPVDAEVAKLEELTRKESEQLLEQFRAQGTKPEKKP